MKVTGADLIDKPTQTAARYCFLVSWTVILVKICELNLQELEILNVPVHSYAFNFVALLLIGFSVLSLTVHWLADLAAWKLWYQKETVNPWLDIAAKNRQDQFDYMFENLNREIKDNFSDNHNERIEKQLNDIKAHLECCGRKFAALRVVGWLYVVGYYFALPMLSEAYALLLVFDPSWLPACDICNPGSSNQNTLHG